MMKKIKYIMALCLMAWSAGAYAQGLDGIVVEKYYLTDAADAAEATANGGSLPVGSTVYRVYVDLAAGYEFGQLYGTPSHNLTVNSTVNFFNDPSNSVSINPGSINFPLMDDETTLIDSWFTTGFAAQNRTGVLKSEDTDGSIGNSAGVLVNNPGDCYGLPIVGAGSQDGIIPFVAGTAVVPNTLGLGAALNVLNATPGNSIVISNGSIAALGGIVGATASNTVLVGQFTTSGTFSFALNVQVVNISTGIPTNYVSSAPVGLEQTHPSLTYSSSNIAPSANISSPANGANIIQGSNITITANALDSDGTISSVEFFVDAVSIGVDNIGPVYSFPYTASVLGPHTIYCIAKDDDCATTTSTTININVIVAPVGGNDTFTGAQNASLAGVAYPIGACFNGTLVGATVSGEGTAANVQVGGGQDKWYKIVAPSSALRVTSSTSAMDVVLELHNSLGAELDVENDVAGIGGEIMTTTGLTVGNTYYVAVRSFNGILGTYNVCLQALMPSTCNDGPGAYNLCSNFKADWTGANSYTFNFVPVLPTPGAPTSATAGSFVSLSNSALALQHGGIYDVTINATYNLVDGAGNPEVVVVPGSDVCTISIAPHASVEVKSAQRCPATVLKGSVLQGKPFVCAASNFTVEFTQVSDCVGTSNIGAPFTVNTTGASSNLSLSFTSPQALNTNSWYRVRFRPNFAYGPGTFGTERYIFVGGSIMSENTIADSEINDEKSVDSIIETSVYPNPGNGENINVNLVGIEDEVVFIRIIDNTGKLIYNNQFVASGSLNTVINFNEPLSTGLYLIEYVVNQEVITERFIVQH